MATNLIDASAAVIRAPFAVQPFGDWTYTDARGAVNARVPEDYDVRRDYARDEHIDAGGESMSGWVGPDGDPDKIRKQFSPYNACGEVLDTIEDAFDAEAQIGFDTLEPRAEGEEIPADIQRLGDEAMNLITQVWDRVQLHEHLKPAIRTAAWAERASLRWWIPPGRAIRVVTEGSSRAELPRAGNFADAAEWLALSRPEPDAAAVVVDQATQASAAVYLDEVEDEDLKLKRAQVAYREGDDLVIRTVYENDERDPEEMRLRTGGLLPMAEMRAKSLFTQSVIATQRQLDFVESILTRTAETAGFPERYIWNAEPPGTRRLLDSVEDQRPGTYLWTGGNGELWEITPEERTLGASTTTELIGVSSVDADNVRHYQTPGVTRFEPTDPAFAIRAASHAYEKILRMCKQGHVAMAGRGEASGYAYEQARAKFLKDLKNRKGAAEGMLREILTSALALMEALTGQVGYFTERIRITADIHVDAGPRSPEERQQDREDVGVNLLSRETAMARSGVEDIEAEIGRIETDPLARLEMLKRAAEVFELIQRSSSAEAAVRALVAAGVDEEIAQALAAQDTDGAGVGL